jgi:hypothetical protein
MKEASPSWKAAFTIKSSTQAKDLLPAAPKSQKRSPIYLGDDLAKVPQLLFEAPPAKERSTKEWTAHVGHALAKADHLNGRTKDGFVKALIAERRDLDGLPWLLGDDCRTSRARSAAFKRVAERLRGAREGPPPPQTFLSKTAQDSQFIDAFVGEPTAESDKDDDEEGEHAVPAEVAARRQIAGAGTPKERLEHIKHLGGVASAEATGELARVAVFDVDKKVRAAALKALSVRRERDYTDVLVKALRYPWPAVAANAAEAVVKLERKDLLPELVALLDEPDPRGPRKEKVGDKEVLVANELVRVNHHKSCLLCHAPVDPEKVPEGVLAAEVPLPSEALPDLSRGYNQQRGPGLLVRIDVTYLRQDFSVMQTVKDADPWPEQQRFDFVLRKRVLSDDEAADLRKRLTKTEEGDLSPYHRAAVRALRDATGRDLEAKSAPWRKLLKMDEKGGKGK